MAGSILCDWGDVDPVMRGLIRKMLILPTSVSPLPYLAAADRLEEVGSKGYEPIMAALREVARVLTVSEGLSGKMSAEQIGGLGLLNLIRMFRGGWVEGRPTERPLKGPGRLVLMVGEELTHLDLNHSQITRGTKRYHRTPMRYTVSPHRWWSVCAKRQNLTGTGAVVYLHPLALYWWLVYPYEV